LVLFFFILFRFFLTSFYLTFLNFSVRLWLLPLFRNRNRVNSKTNSLLATAEAVGGLRGCLDQDDSLSSLQRYIEHRAGVRRYVCQRVEGLLGTIRGTRHWLESVRRWAISPPSLSLSLSLALARVSAIIFRENRGIVETRNLLYALKVFGNYAGFFFAENDCTSLALP